MRKAPMKRSLLLPLLIAAVAIALLAWRLWPRSFQGTAKFSPAEILSLSATLSETFIEDGSLGVDHWKLEDNEAGERALLDLLARSKWRPSFRDLLPWGPTSLDGGHGTLSLGVALPQDRAFFLTVNSTGGAFFSPAGGERTYIYYAVDQELFARLAAVMKGYGVDVRP